MASTFYWHDYETFGVDPRLDRPAQFAGQRTDLDLEPVGEPLEIWCRLSPDYLPQPEACALTGVGPAEAERLGMRERDFVHAIHRELAQPGTCTVGYNNLRFDDEVTRCALFRNLLDPYGREYLNGNSRWDLLDVFRLARTFRPEGLEWPDGEDGVPSFRLEHLTAANGIPHAQAHTALADVRATIALARRLKAAQPRLWAFALQARDKNWVREQVDPARPQPLIHVSGMFKASLGSFSLVWPMAWLPGRSNEVLLWDLRFDPEAFQALDAEALARRAFTPAETLAGQGLQRLPAKTIRINRCPMVVRDLRLLTPALADRYQADPNQARERGRRLQALPGFLERLRAVYAGSGAVATAAADPDFSIYSGGFLGAGDRTWLDRIAQAGPESLAGLRPVFQDDRLEELFFRYRARNWPETLAPAEAERWRAHCRNRLEHPPAPGLLDRQGFRAALTRCRDRQPERVALWDALAAYEQKLN